MFSQEDRKIGSVSGAPNWTDDRVELYGAVQGDAIVLKPWRPNLCSTFLPFRSPCEKIWVRKRSSQWRPTTQLPAIAFICRSLSR